MDAGREGGEMRLSKEKKKIIFSALLEEIRKRTFADIKNGTCEDHPIDQLLKSIEFIERECLKFRGSKR
jgi:hypothetical protein